LPGRAGRARGAPAVVDRAGAEPAPGRAALRRVDRAHRLQRQRGDHVSGLARPAVHARAALRGGGRGRHGRRADGDRQRAEPGGAGHSGALFRRRYLAARPGGRGRAADLRDGSLLLSVLADYFRRAARVEAVAGVARGNLAEKAVDREPVRVDRWRMLNDHDRSRDNKDIVIKENEMSWVVRRMIVLSLVLAIVGSGAGWASAQQPAPPAQPPSTSPPAAEPGAAGGNITRGIQLARATSQHRPAAA